MQRASLAMSRFQRQKNWSNRSCNVSSVSKLTYSDKSLIAEVDSDLIRTPVAGDAISDNVKRAVIATEDENFENHKGLYLKPFFGQHLDP